MHRALQIEDIIHQIFENCRPPSESADFFHSNGDFNEDINLKQGVDTQSLLNAALTCRVFSGPALDALWWAMEDFTPLFSLVPNFIDYKDDGYDPDTPMSFWGPIEKSDCQIFFAYANRIKFYRFRAYRRIYISSYIHVSQASGRSCLLPSLRYLHCEDDGPELLFLLSPCLRIFSSIAEDSDIPSDTWLFLQNLRGTTSGLGCLNLNFHISDRCMAGISKIPQLQRLFLRAALQDKNLLISNGFFERLSASETLTHLRIEGHIVTAFSPPRSPQVLSFPGLKVIKILSGLSSIADATNLLRMATFPQLERLELALLRNESSTEHWQELYKYLGNPINPVFKSLCFLEDEHITGYWEIIEDLIPPLPHLRNIDLTSFSIELPFQISIIHIETIIASWPNLTDLNLIPDIPEEIGFSALIEIAKGLPLLCTLKIPVNCLKLLSADDVPVLVHGLKSLTLKQSTLKDALLLAHCLDRIFPNITTQEIKDSEYSAHKKMWAQVGPLLDLLQSARKDQEFRSLQFGNHASSNP